MNLSDLFDLSLRCRRHEAALEIGERTWSFAELDERSRRWAAFLAGSGIGRGERLGLLLPNGIDLVEVFLAAARLGAAVVPMNVLYRERELAHLSADSEPRAVVTTAELAARLPTGTSTVLVEEAAAPVARTPPVRGRSTVSGGDAALVAYTSGTTGRAKGAVLTHDNLAANALVLDTCWRLSPSDRLLLALPLFHLHGLGNGLHTWLSTGFRLRLLDRFRKETILDELERFRPTVFFGVPTMYERLCAAPPERARRIGRSMRLFVSGSAPLPGATLERFRELFGHAILERYGMTEALMIASNPYAGERRPGSVGLALPGVSLRLAAPDGNAAPTEAGEVGEVEVRGPSVFAGYWRDSEATRAAFTADGWFRTGDLGTLAPDGYLTLVGRRSDLIISGGFNVYPREIEDLLREQPSVAEAAVVGELDAVRGEVPVAYVVAAEGARIDATALEATCRAALASFKVPRRFEVVPELPRNALGKVERARLGAGADARSPTPRGRG